MLFHSATIGKGHIDFNHTDFGVGNVSFYSTQFGEGNITFNYAKFGDKQKKLNNSSLSFCNAKFDDGNVSFDYTDFYCNRVTFSGVEFKESITLKGTQSRCVIDLTATKINFPINLDKSHIGYDSSTYGKNTTAAFRRLKKLAKEAEDNEREIDFFAKEIRSSYKYALKEKKFTRYAYQLYDFFSDFGRSFTRPLFFLLSSGILFSSIYGFILFDQNIIAPYVPLLPIIIILILSVIVTLYKKHPILNTATLSGYLHRFSFIIFYVFLNAS